MKTRTTVTIISLMLITSLLGLVTSSEPASANPTTAQVLPGDSIQAAINNAKSGDTIIVAAGTYKENVTINKAITLKGSGQNVTTIQAKVNWKAVIDIQSNNVNVSGFTIQSGSSGISINGYNASRINYNKIVSNNGEGIRLSSSWANTIYSNVISLNGFEGVYLEDSASNLIYNNTMIYNGYSGVALFEASNNIVSNNTIALSRGYEGLYLESSNGSIFDGNTLSNNNNGASLYKSYNNVFYHNNFINNKYQVDTLTAMNSWNSTAVGNYWSDYTQRYPDAHEVGSTGIWDTPYVIDATNQDDFPLMNPWNPPADVTPPFTTDGYDNLWHNEDFSISLTAVDDLSGVKETYYIINGGQLNNLSANGQPYIGTESSNNTLEYWSTDKAGNNETHHFLTGIKLDKTPPSGSIQINNGDAYTSSLSVTLNPSATDSTSGVAQMRLSNDNTTWTPTESYSASKAWNLTEGDGAKTVYIIYVDNAGLNSQVYNDTIVLDTGPPILSISYPDMNAQITSSNVTIEWNGTDAGSGIDHYELAVDGGQPTNVGTVQSYALSSLSDGNHTVVVKAIDKIGQINEASVSFIVNTSLTWGLGYIQTIALIIIGAIVTGIILGVFMVRKKRRTERKPNLPEA